MGYIPKADAVFLVSDINQGTLSKSTLNFLEYSKLLDKKIFLILTKSDTKTEKEIKELKDYFRQNFDIFEEIAITSARANELTEFYRLIDKVKIFSAEILADRARSQLKALCTIVKIYCETTYRHQNLTSRKLKKKFLKRKNSLAPQKESSAKR